MTRDIRRYVIAYTSVTEGYIGKVSVMGENSSFLELTDAHALLGGYQFSQSGQVGRNMIVLPLELLADSQPIVVRPVSVLTLYSLSDEDFKVLGKTLELALENADNMRLAIKAQRSGLVVANSISNSGNGPNRGTIIR